MVCTTNITYKFYFEGGRMIHLTPQQKRVLALIQNHPRAANDDAYLLDIYWHEYDGWLDNRSLYDNLSRATPPGAITRCRRKLHELGYITYSKEADKAREDKFIEYRDENSNYSAVRWAD
jgi:hypothetical protein